MKLSDISLVVLLSISMTVFAAAQSDTHDYSKMHKRSDSTLVKNAHQKMIKERYTCAMHPEVISDQPGKCPKCGMTLIKVKPAANVKKSHKMHKDISLSHPDKMH